MMERRSMRQIADCYVLSGNIDTALVLYNDVLDGIPPQRLHIKADVYKNIAVTYKDAGYLDESLSFIRKSIEISPNETLYPIQYMLLASIHEDMGKRDSSLYYNRVALQYAKKQKNLDMIYKAYDALFEADHRHRFNTYMLSAPSDTIYQKQKYELAKYQKLYNIEKIKKRDKELIAKAQRYIYCSVLLFIGLVSLYLYQRNQRKKRQLQYEKELEDKNHIIHSIRNSLYQRLEIYKRMVRLSISPNRAKHKLFLMEYNKILFDHDDDSDFAIDWDIIFDWSNCIYDNYIEKLSLYYPSISDIEKKIIILQKISFNITEISAILEKSVHTIYKYSSNIRKHLNIPEGDNIIDYLDKKLGK